MSGQWTLDPATNAWYRLEPHGGWIWKVYYENRFQSHLYVHPITRTYVPTNDDGTPRLTPQQPSLNSNNPPTSPAASQHYQHSTPQNVAPPPQPAPPSHPNHRGMQVATIGESQTYDTLDPDFKLPKNAKKFFRVGRAFSVVWSQPAGNGANPQSSEYSSNFLGEGVFSKVTRFVVVVEGSESCTALKITTYGRQGLARRGIVRADHCIVYTGDHAPALTLPEQNNPNDLMYADAIKVVPKTDGDRLDSMSRMNFRKVYNIEHNVKVKELGKVWDKHIDNNLRGQFERIFFGRR